VRPCLTIALLLLASMGAQGGSANMRGGDHVTPRLLAALMEQPAGILAPSQLTVPPAGKFIFSGLVTPPSTACTDDVTIAAAAATGAVVQQLELIPAEHPACTPRVTRGP
jgi:hypothetical protein